MRERVKRLFKLSSSGGRHLAGAQLIGFAVEEARQAQGHPRGEGTRRNRGRASAPFQPAALYRNARLEGRDAVKRAGRY